MNITAVRLTPVNVPLDAPFLWSGGLDQRTTKVVVDVETDDGLAGLGEGPSDQLMPALAGMVERVIGRDA